MSEDLKDLGAALGWLAFTLSTPFVLMAILEMFK